MLSDIDINVPSTFGPESAGLRKALSSGEQRGVSGAALQVRRCPKPCGAVEYVGPSGRVAAGTDHTSLCPFKANVNGSSQDTTNAGLPKAGVKRPSDGIRDDSDMIIADRYGDKENVECSQGSQGSIGGACGHHNGKTCTEVDDLLAEKDSMISALEKLLVQKSTDLRAMKKKFEAQKLAFESAQAQRTSSHTGLTVAPSGSSGFEKIYVRLPNDDGCKHFVMRAGEYHRVQHMGRDGTFGSLVCATRMRDGKSVIIKRQTIADIGNCETSLRELSCLAFLTVHAPHPNIIELLDCWVYENHLYIVEEKHPGTLRDLIRKNAVTASRRFNLLAGLMSGLRHLHACGILHRDLKPSNIVVDASGTAPRIIDLGSGRRSGNHMTAGVHVTTYPYRAPEVHKKAQYASKVDVWSAGCIMAEMITCKRFFACQEDQLERFQYEYDSRVRRAGPRNPQVRFPEQVTAGATKTELEVLEGLIEIDQEKRWSAEQCLASIGQPSFNERASRTYVEKEYDVHDLRGMHKLINQEIEAFVAAARKDRH